MSGRSLKLNIEKLNVSRIHILFNLKRFSPEKRRGRVFVNAQSCILKLNDMIVSHSKKINHFSTGWTKKNATLGIGWGYYSKKYATTLILIR